MDDKVIIEKIDGASPILEWSVIVPYDNKWKVKSIVTACIFLFFLGCVIYTNYDGFDVPDFFSFSFLMIICPWVFYYVLWANFSYSYKLTKYGYVCTHYQKIPKIMYHIGYVVAVMGGFVAILGAIVAGPSAFLGGGIFLLVGLFSGNLNIMPSPKKTYMYLLGGVKHVIFIPEKDNKFFIMSEPFSWATSDAVYVSSDIKEQVKSKILKVATNVEYYNVEYYDDFYVHPRCLEIKENRRKAHT